MTTADELLLRLVEADEATRPNRESFLVWELNTHPTPLIEHPGFGGEGKYLGWSEPDIADLVDSGYIRRDQRRTPERLEVTGAGFEHASRLRLATAAGGVAASQGEKPMQWETRVLPVLEAVGRAYTQQQPGIGVSIHMINGELGREPEDTETAIILDELVFAGYLESTIDTDVSIGPLWCRLTEKGHQVTGGWPSASGQLAFERLLAILDERIASAETDEERTKWETFREGALGVGRDVMTGVLTTTVNAAAKGLIS